MSIAPTVAGFLKDHVTLAVESIDRLYLNAYVPQLQSEGGAVGFFRRDRGVPFASAAVMAPISAEFIKSIERFVQTQRLPLITFQNPKKERKDAVAAKHLERFSGPEGVFLVGKAQEKVSCFRNQKRRNRETGKTYPWIYRTTAMINQYDFYLVDADFGRMFIKFASYFPYPAKVCLNGRAAGPDRHSAEYHYPGPQTRSPLCATGASGTRRSFAIASRPRGLTESSASGCGNCRIPSARGSERPGTAMTSPSCAMRVRDPGDQAMQAETTEVIGHRAGRDGRWGGAQQGYAVTPQGLRIAIFCRRVYARILRPGIALTTADAAGPQTTPLRAAFEELDDVIER